AEFFSQDMCALDLKSRDFDAASCLFDAIGFVVTNENIDRALRSIARHVKPRGLLVMEFWHAAAMLRHFDPVRVRRWKTAKGDILRISETSLDYARQQASVRYQVLQLCNDSTYTSFEEVQTNRFFLQQEMAALLTHAGWQPLDWFAGFQ